MMCVSMGRYRYSLRGMVATKDPRDGRSRSERKGRVTRSMTGTLKPTSKYSEFSQKRERQAGRKWNKYLSKNRLLLNNMVHTEKMKRELIYAIQSKAAITIPEVESVDENEYDEMYPVAFHKMPKDLIVIIEGEQEEQEESDNDDGDDDEEEEHFQQPQVTSELELKKLNLTKPENLPILKVRRIEFDKILGKEVNVVGKRFQILTESSKRVKLEMSQPDGERKTFYVQK